MRGKNIAMATIQILTFLPIAILFFSLLPFFIQDWLLEIILKKKTKHCDIFVFKCRLCARLVRMMVL